MVDARARSFDRAADEYERGRPEWPEEALDVLDIRADATVLDLGAGTGKLTRLLVKRYARVIAVEPLDRMRGLLEELVPGAEALAGRAEQIPLPDASVDAVFVAEAFHWFGGDDAGREIARVLRPNGTLVLLWNEGGGSPEPSLPEAFRARLRRRGAEFPYGDDRWRAALERGPFSAIAEAAVENVHQLDRETMLASAASWSWIASLPDAEREHELAELATHLPDGRWRVPLRTEIFWTRRTA
jgi:SAM-dependent methyltransferase